MPAVREIPRAAVDGYLKAVKWPLEQAARRFDGDGGAELVLDRADAAVRDAVGSVLRDPELREDARRRRLAATEREKALRLRERAQSTSAKAADELEQR